MKMRIKLTLVLLALMAGISQLVAQGTAFTYQGRLDSGGAPADGFYDLRFAIYDSAGGGSLVGGPLTNGQYSVTGGFWALPTAVQTTNAPMLTIAPANPGFATVSWTPVTGTNWLLQERLSLSGGTWSNSPSGATNPITVLATLPAKFYRLFKP